MTAPALRVYDLATASLRLQVCNYGGRIVALHAPDRDGRFGDVVLGYDHLNDYLTDTHFMGALIGRYANRIARGRFRLHDRDYQITRHRSGNALHGGLGFHGRYWQVQQESAQSLVLSYLSSDGEEGFPGTLHTRVRYRLVDNELRIEYAAATDRDTVVNLTSHAYFNLAGTGSILDHQLTIHAQNFTPVDATLIPTGEIRSVVDTPFDFRSAQRIGERIDGDDQQLRFGQGYDHNWALACGPRAQHEFAAEVYEPISGRLMQVLTTEPGLQFYSGNFLDDVAGKGGVRYGTHTGFCLETQHFPDSPNQSGFPSTLLKAGETFTSTTIYRFAVKGM